MALAPERSRKTSFAFWGKHSTLVASLTAPAADRWHSRAKWSMEDLPRGRIPVREGSAYCDGRLAGARARSDGAMRRAAVPLVGAGGGHAPADGSMPAAASSPPWSLTWQPGFKGL